MGVKGLWQLLNPAGKPIDPHSLEGKILGVDVSIWLYQAMCGSSSPNAYLHVLMRRIAKLMFYRIRPVFVFDGPNVPEWKRRVLSERRAKKMKASARSEALKSKMMTARLKRALQRRLTAGQKLEVTAQDLDLIEIHARATEQANQQRQIFLIADNSKLGVESPEKTKKWFAKDTNAYATLVEKYYICIQAEDPELAQYLSIRNHANENWLSCNRRFFSSNFHEKQHQAETPKLALIASWIIRRHRFRS